MTTVSFIKEAQKKYPPKKDSQPLKQVKRNRYSDLAGLAITILLGILIYSNSFNCSFHFDDTFQIVHNSVIRNLADVKGLWNNYSTRPIGMFTFALNYHFNQLDVWYYHLINLIIHLINACLIWWLTLLIFSSPALKDNPITRHKQGVAFFMALLFVSHPLATQSVTYIIQRLASMVTMFYLLSLALYMKARLADKSATSKYLLFTGSFLSALLALYTKENAFTLPFVVVLSEIFFLKTKKHSINFRDYRIILLIAALVGVILIIPSKVSLTIFNPIPPSEGHPYNVTPFNYLFTQFSVITKYIRLLILPVYQNLDYDFPISNNFFETRTLLSFLVLLSLIILAIVFFKRYRIISFGIFWFFITLSIESSFIPIKDVIFEHRTYLPSFGFFLILSSGIYILFWNKYKFVAISVFVIVIASNSILTYERNKVWKNDLTLWNDVVSKSPNKARSIISLGDSYGQLGRWENSIAAYSRAIGISPDYLSAYNNRGIAYRNLGQWDKAIADYSKAIGINPKYFTAYYNRANVYDNLRQWSRAIADYSEAIGINPKFAIAYYNRGIDYGSLGQWDKSIVDYSRAIEINPKYDTAYYNRGIVYRNLGQWDKAIADFSMAIEIYPKNINAYSNRGAAYGNLRQWDKSITDYSRVIEINPNYATAYYNRGIDYANLGQWDKSIADYSRAIEIDPKYTNAYSNRGVAYKKLGQWDKSIADYSRAIEINPKYATAYYNRGNAYDNIRQWSKAIADYSKAIELDPNIHMAYSNREAAYKKLRDEKKK